MDYELMVKCRKCLFMRSSHLFGAVHSILSLLLFVLFSDRAFAESDVVNFLEEYCLECHDMETAKGEFVLEPLHFDFTESSSVDVFQKF